MPRRRWTPIWTCSATTTCKPSTSCHRSGRVRPTSACRPWREGRKPWRLVLPRKAVLKYQTAALPQRSANSCLVLASQQATPNKTATPGAALVGAARVVAINLSRWRQCSGSCRSARTHPWPASGQERLVTSGTDCCSTPQLGNGNAKHLFYAEPQVKNH